MNIERKISEKSGDLCDAATANSSAASKNSKTIL